MRDLLDRDIPRSRSVSVEADISAGEALHDAFTAALQQWPRAHGWHYTAFRE